ncbi:nucleoside-diphosphate kinase [Desulfosoma caldarium]|uniref:Nucleoside diphosphate kinase n=1 Tax=Desulfosoma caldarium TaxID=610254 RepID=A0A3N1VF25_9BACT|nr:nucleoside-diphosphate kinase [Desulfosoma caldarium]ROR01493.1 nucleoside diphosphate kinase [Desulfosoma caldarium]
MERTLSIIKPDGVQRNLVGTIVGRFESEGFRIAGMKRLWLSKKEAEAFYAMHKDRPFFDSLTSYMSSGPVVVMVLEGPNAIQRNRDIMGDTNPAQAAEGTIRKEYGLDVEKNTVHGSDKPETAAKEIAFFFSELELMR